MSQTAVITSKNYPAWKLHQFVIAIKLKNLFSFHSKINSKINEQHLKLPIRSRDT